MARNVSYNLGDYVHCIKRGAFGNKIFRDTSDYYRFLRLLYTLNDEYVDNNSSRVEVTSKLFERPSHYPERVPIVDIVAFTAMPNHFHLLLHERIKGGVSLFMKRLGVSMSYAFNKKYNNSGSIFQSKYKPVIICDDNHLRDIVPYIVLKNVFELFPDGGIRAAKENFEEAYTFALAYPFSNLQTFAKGKQSPIVSEEEVVSLRKENFVRPIGEFDSFAKRYIEGYVPKHTDM